ncbi:hypothetical protein VTO42DRAFT_3054 [Malbranchea cinnamomea]
MASDASDLKSKLNPKDSMKSTWRQSPDRSQWTFAHWLTEIFNLHHISLDKEVPVHSKQDKVPYLPEWKETVWVTFWSSIPLVLHQLYASYTGRNFGPVAAFFYYSLAFKLIAIHEIHILRRLGHKYGFFDGDKHERDGVPDVGVVKTFFSLVSTSTFRPMMSVFIAYRTSKTPLSMNWAWLPVEVALYGVVLDFWFYWYHRLMHDVNGLWKYHRTHHLTKHPNPLLTLYADTEQEIFDIAGIPLMTYFTLKLMGLPMGFYEWWVCHQFIVFSELAGHSGVRVHVTTPGPISWLLKLLGAELVIEDHDLHHRQGWKSSFNYGKQTRLWDRVFGTFRPRIECAEDNVDYNNVVSFPLF